MRFAVVGDCTLDIVVVQERRRRHAGDVPARIRLGPGGQAANVAVRLARLGMAVRLVAPLADDLAGRLLRDALEQDGVSIAPLPSERSAAVAVLLDAGGERTMLSDRQPLAAAAAAAALAGVEWVHCSGYALLDDATGDALAATLGARPSSVRLSVGGGSLPPQRARVSRFRARLGSAAPQLCILSRDEAGAMLGRASPLASEAATQLASLADVVVVTAGADGSAATLGGGLWTAPRSDVAGPVVDATGAGDAYAAALIARLASAPWPPRPRELRRAMAAAGRLGARVARVAGAQGRVAGERRRAR
jgi:sugar/nucleoside kinase (ribokinase family)